MDTTPRNLFIAGAAADLLALLVSVALVDNVTDRGGPLPAGVALAAIGAATTAIIGAAMILTAVLLVANERRMESIESRISSYADGVLEGARESLDAVVGRLADALPSPINNNVRNLHPSSRSHWPRP